MIGGIPTPSPTPIAILSDCDNPPPPVSAGVEVDVGLLWADVSCGPVVVAVGVVLTLVTPGAIAITLATPSHQYVLPFL
jgi:hypothetical protein